MLCALWSCRCKSREWALSPPYRHLARASPCSCPGHAYRSSNHDGDDRYGDVGNQQFYPESLHVRRTYWTASTPHRSGRARFTVAARGEKVSATLATGKGLPRELLGTTRLWQRLAARCQKRLLGAAGR